MTCLRFIFYMIKICNFKKEVCRRFVSTVRKELLDVPTTSSHNLVCLGTKLLAALTAFMFQNKPAIKYTENNNKQYCMTRERKIQERDH